VARLVEQVDVLVRWMPPRNIPEFWNI